MELTNKTILITGGTSGIGHELAKQLINAGNKVIICGRRADRLEQAKAGLPQLVVRQCDVSDAIQREELFTWASQNFPDLNILINNAGVQLLTDLTKPVDLSRVHNEIEVNLVAPLHLSSLFASFLGTKKDAAIVNISSGLAFAPLAFMAVYCATKAAIHSATLSLRHQLKDTSIRVFEIAPPAVDTELGHDRREDKTQSHGGMNVEEFVSAALEAIKSDEYETAIGQAAGLRAKREQLFETMNSNH